MLLVVRSVTKLWYVSSAASMARLKFVTPRTIYVQSMSSVLAPKLHSTFYLAMLTVGRALMMNFNRLSAMYHECEKSRGISIQTGIMSASE